MCLKFPGGIIVYVASEKATSLFVVNKFIYPGLVYTNCAVVYSYSPTCVLLCCVCVCVLCV